MSPVADAGVPEIHAGKDETSAMLALAPDLVRRERIGELKSPPDGGLGAGVDPRSGERAGRGAATIRALRTAA